MFQFHAAGTCPLRKGRIVDVRNSAGSAGMVRVRAAIAVLGCAAMLLAGAVALLAEGQSTAVVRQPLPRLLEVT